MNININNNTVNNPAAVNIIPSMMMKSPSSDDEENITSINNNNKTKYDIRINPPYQIDYHIEETGKRIVATKKRVRFRFGFSNANSIVNHNAKGVDARGIEHEIVFVWSLTSGKRLVLADGNEVHFSKSKPFSETKFECTWTISGTNHNLKLIAHATMPLYPTPGFRQFDLLLDGMSFFDMKHIYELGCGSSNMTDLATSSNGGIYEYNNYSRLDDRRQQNNTYNDTKGWISSSRSAPPPSESRHGVYFNEEANYILDDHKSTMSMPADLVSDPTPVSYVQDHISSQVALIDQALSIADNNITTTTDNNNNVSLSSSASTMNNDEFAPVTPLPSAPPTVPSPVSHSIIMGAYHDQTQQPALVTPTSSGMNTNANPNQIYNGSALPPFETSLSPVSTVSTPSYFNLPTATPFKQPEQQRVAVAESSTPSYYQQEGRDDDNNYCTVSKNHNDNKTVDDCVEPSLESLVNLDDITAEARRVSPKEKQQQMANDKSYALPPQTGYYGPNATLADIQSSTHQRTPKPKKEVMINHHHHNNNTTSGTAGTMVLYGNNSSISNNASQVPFQLPTFENTAASSSFCAMPSTYAY